MKELGAGTLLKMKSSLEEVVHYQLPLGEESIPLNQYLGRKIHLRYLKKIRCLHSGKEIKKSYGQGYSYEAFSTLARCDTCIIKPHLCHYHQGTCREPAWGEKHCFKPHIIYLANTGSVKIGITRETQVPTRWIDQGAHQALAILRVASRRDAGLIELEISRTMSDRTQWKKMLLSDGRSEIFLEGKREELFLQFEHLLDDLAAEDLNEEVLPIRYPLLDLPGDLKSVSFDKTPELAGTLVGIKGQYLIFDHGAVINLRKHQGYQVALAVE